MDRNGTRKGEPAPKPRRGKVDPRRVREAVEKFFGARIWLPTTGDLRRGQGLLYRMARILYATVQGGREQRLNFRAAALTYFSVLSIVPFLAFAFAVLKGFGEYQRLMDETLRPFLRETFGANPELLAGMEQVLTFVEKTNVSGMGAIGILLLAYTSISLLSNIETSLNDIWGAKTARPFIRQVTDYTTLLVITPLMILAAVAFGALAQSSGVLSFLRDRLALGVLIDLFLKLTSVVLGCIAMTALFVLLPNVKTRLSSAIFGGVIGGILWQALLIAHVKFQIGVANYNALYASFGAIPIFLVWIYMSWRVTLLGAQLAASHQHEQHIHQTKRARHVDQDLRETLAVAIASVATSRFLARLPPPTPTELAAGLQAPVPTVDELVDTLAKRGVLVRAVAGSEIAYVPGRDVDALRLSDIREAVRVDPCADELKEDVKEQLGADMIALLERIERSGRDNEDNLTLRQLAALAAATPATKMEDGAAARTEDAAVIDGKQPTVAG
ncbi:MAG TPA: YihY/virulence factor BrkB family protein [Polyangia bacterium]